MKPLIAPLVLLLFTSLSAFSQSATPEGATERDRFADEVRAIFEREDFAELERLADELRSTKARFPEGLWKLSRFYAGLSPGSYTDEQWNDRVARLERWRAQFPQSITEPVVRAESWITYGWTARGSGYASTVTEKASQLLQQRLAEARTILESAAKLPRRCPQWFVAMQVVARGAEWDRAQAQRLFEEAVAAEPGYHAYYFNHAYYLTPKWFGQPGDWERFAENVTKGPAKSEGMSMYARIAWSREADYENLFTDTKIEWSKMKQGFEDMMKANPDSSWNLNNFCRFAVMAGDRETARALFQRIGDNIDPVAWKVAGRAELAKSWAESAAPLPSERTKYSIRDTRAHSVAFSRDGKLVATGYSNGDVVILDGRNGRLVRRIPAAREMVRTVAFSPDGKLLAAGIGDEFGAKPGLLGIWDTTNWKERKSFRPEKGPVTAIAFAPDGRTLIAVGGPYNKGAEVQKISLFNFGVTHIAEMENHKHHLDAIAISPDNASLVVNCTHPSIVPWDLKTSKFTLTDDGLPTRGFACAIAFSPNGKQLAVGCAPSWKQREKPGALMFFDTSTWQEQKPEITATMGGIFAIAYSPDGRLIAAGSSDHSIRIWDAETKEQVGTLAGHNDRVSGLAFSPDGRTLASCGFDGDVKFWDTPRRASN
jgi:WD40 repeat protein